MVYIFTLNRPVFEFHLIFAWSLLWRIGWGWVGIQQRWNTHSSSSFITRSKSITIECLDIYMDWLSVSSAFSTLNTSIYRFLAYLQSRDSTAFLGRYDGC